MFIFYLKSDVNTQICYSPPPSRGPGKMPKISVILRDDSLRLAGWVILLPALPCPGACSPCFPGRSRAWLV